MPRHRSPQFIPGLKLSELYYWQIVLPILNRHFARLKHAAALIGHGSEVLGFDDSQSTDHDWGPRTLLFLRDRDYAKRASKLRRALETEIPPKFMGYPTRIHLSGKGRKQLLVEVHSIKSYFTRTNREKSLTFDPCKNLTAMDWLVFPQQELLALTEGKVFRDDFGDLTRIRRQLAYYPHDVWLYLLASQWRKLSQEEAFAGRAHQAGDALGSSIIALRQVREMMRLCFLMERKYIPYSKWFGSSFARLKLAKRFTPTLQKILLVKTFAEREKYLSRAYEFLAKRHNSLKITRRMHTKVSWYHGRPFKVIHGEEFEAAVRARIKEPRIRNLKVKIGSIDQFADNSDLLCDPILCRRLKPLYR